MTYTAFLDTSLLATGPLADVLTKVKPWFDRDPGRVILFFEDETGRQVDFDLRGTVSEVVARVLPPPGRGRPRLGVVAREVSLLPRHWEWLEQQPNGASAALRRLVEEARKQDTGEQRTIDAVGRFLTAMAGNLPGYEEAARALYRRDRLLLDDLMLDWPHDIRAHVQHLLGDEV